jgi:hypothetical protein
MSVGIEIVEKITGLGIDFPLGTVDSNKPQCRYALGG